VHNAIYSKIGRTASEEVVLSLVKSKCLPYLLYGVDVNTHEYNWIEVNWVVLVLMNIFRTSSESTLGDYQFYFNILSIKT